MNTDGSQQSWNPIRIDDGDRALAPAFDLLLNHWPTEILTTQRLSAAQVIWRWITHVLKRGQDQGSHDGGQAVVFLTRRLIEERHREADLSVEAIAAALQRNHSALTRTVRHYTGWSIAELIQQRRLAAAQALLRDQWRSIASIAEASGFGSARYFATVFKAWCGVTPSSYRKLGHLEPELNLHPKQDDPGLS
jgi:AraC-like DNA-binding protein